MANMYKERKLTLERAAELSGVSIRELIDYLRQKEIEIGNLSAKELDEDIMNMYKKFN